MAEAIVEVCGRKDKQIKSIKNKNKNCPAMSTKERNAAQPVGSEW